MPLLTGIVLRNYKHILSCHDLYSSSDLIISTILSPTDKSKRPTFIPKPKVPQQVKDTLPSIPLEPTIQSRTFGNSLEGYHLQKDVHDLRNCRYLRFKDTDLTNTLNDAVEGEINTAPTHTKRKMSSWAHLDLPIRRPKLNSIN